MDNKIVTALQQLVTYVQWQWLDRQTLGLGNLNVHDNSLWTNNVLESYYASLRCHIQVTVTLAQMHAFVS